MPRMVNEMAKIYVDEYNSGTFRRIIECNSGENLYEVLTRNDIPINGAVCNGAAVCRGCQVYIVEEGMECLTCHYYIQAEELHIVLEGKFAEQSILLAGTANININVEEADIQITELELCDNNNTGPVGIVFHIGTTTIASALVNLETGEICSELGCLNRQAHFGADVISRIQYTTDDDESDSHLQNMHKILCKDIEALMQVYEKEGYSKKRMKKLVFSGNTTMLHFLLKQPVNGMSAYPFTPEFLEAKQYQEAGMEVVILPGKSAFVGADVVAGVRYLELGTSEEYQMLIDLGTNGELWLLNQEQGVCTSTSCGPAFANSVTKGSAQGTSLLQELAKAYSNGSVDSSGLLQGEYFEKGISCGEIMITQESVRQIQLAKSAIRTGIELSAYELRIPLEKISQVYLAGGFGFFLDLESAYTLGLFPEEFRGKIQIIGNSSLKGAVRALTDTDTMLTLPRQLAKSRVLDLSMSKNFQEFFLHRIPFPELRSF